MVGRVEPLRWRRQLNEESSMKQSTLLMSAFLSVLSLSACDREKTVVSNPPAPAVATTEPSPAPPPVTVQVPVPVPVPVPGPPGPQGEPGKAGAPGDTHVIVTPPAASEPK
jgi:hypothetical protein